MSSVDLELWQGADRGVSDGFVNISNRTEEDCSDFSRRNKIQWCTCMESIASISASADLLREIVYWTSRRCFAELNDIDLWSCKLESVFVVVFRRWPVQWFRHYRGVWWDQWPAAAAVVAAVLSQCLSRHRCFLPRRNPLENLHDLTSCNFSLLDTRRENSGIFTSQTSLIFFHSSDLLFFCRNCCLCLPNKRIVLHNKSVVGGRGNTTTSEILLSIPPSVLPWEEKIVLQCCKQAQAQHATACSKPKGEGSTAWDSGTPSMAYWIHLRHRGIAHVHAQIVSGLAINTAFFWTQTWSSSLKNLRGKYYIPCSVESRRQIDCCHVRSICCSQTSKTKKFAALSAWSRRLSNPSRHFPSTAISVSRRNSEDEESQREIMLGLTLVYVLACFSLWSSSSLPPWI